MREVRYGQGGSWYQLRSVQVQIARLHQNQLIATKSSRLMQRLSWYLLPQITLRRPSSGSGCVCWGVLPWPLAVGPRMCQRVTGLVVSRVPFMVAGPSAWAFGCLGK